MRQRRLLVQVAVAAVLLGLVALLVNNLAVNLIRTGLGLGFGWLADPLVLLWRKQLSPMPHPIATSGL